MRKNKLTHLLEPSLRLYFVFLLLFAAVSALFSVCLLYTSDAADE